MIEIDTHDELYKYLLELGVEDIETEYKNLAEAGRFKRADIRSFYADCLRPSIITEDIDEAELDKILDYFVDLKKLKTIPKAQEKELLKQYKENPTRETENILLNNHLKDVLYLSINYKSVHENVDLQDVVQVANMGLIEAVKHYRLSKSLSVEDYITYWVARKIKDEFEEKYND